MSTLTATPPVGNRSRSIGDRFVSVSTRRTCPVCSKPKLCRVARDGGTVLCYGHDEPRDRDWIERRRDQDTNGLNYRVFLHRARRPWFVRHEHVPIDDGPPEHPDVSHLAEAFEKNLTAEDARRLLEQLGVPGWGAEVLHKIGVGFVPARGRRRPAWTFRERDGAARTVGLSCRHAGGDKSMVAGGHRGLTIPDGWEQRAIRAGVVLVVEGASDVTAGTAAGLPMVGRPSNVGGTAFLAALFARLPASVKALVVGERDGPKLKDGRWPGRAGASRTAAVLGRRLGRVAYWTMPPRAYKDLREYLVKKAGPKATRRRWERTGAELLRRLQAEAAPADDSDPFQQGKDMANELPNKKCLSPYTLALSHKHTDCLHCSADVRCRRWTCSGCRWANLYQWVVGVGDRLRDYTDADSRSDDPNAWPGDAGNLCDVGPWSLGVAVVPKKRIASVRQAKGLEYVAVQTALESEDADAVCGRSLRLSLIGPPESNQTKSQTLEPSDRYLMLVAVAPGEPFPRGFARVTQTEFLKLFVEAARLMPSVPVGEDKKTRLRPVLASGGLRPRPDVKQPGNWVRKGQHDRPADQVGEIAADLGVQAKATVAGPNVMGDAHGRTLSRWQEWMLRLLTTRSPGERVLSRERVTSLMEWWERHLPADDIPEGPAVCHILRLYARTGPPGDLADQLREAIEDDVRTKPERVRRAESRRAAEAAFADVARTLAYMRELYWTDRSTHGDPLYLDVFGPPPKYLRRKRTEKEKAERAATPRWRRGDRTKTRKYQQTVGPVRG